MLNTGQNPCMGHEHQNQMRLDSVECFVSTLTHTREDAKLALKKAADDMK